MLLLVVAGLLGTRQGGATRPLTPTHGLGTAQGLRVADLVEETGAPRARGHTPRAEQSAEVEGALEAQWTRPAVVLTPVDVRGRALERAASPPSLALELWDTDAGRTVDDGWSGGGAVTLRWGEGGERGLVQLAPLTRSDGLETRWYLDPAQPGACRGPRGVGTALAVAAGDVRALAVAPGGLVSGSVVTGDLDPTRIGVRVVAMEGSDDTEVRLREIAPDGTFVVRGVDAGARRVEVLLDGLAVVAVGPLVVRLGEACHDPRLERIDLPAELVWCSLTVVDEVGAPIEGARCAILSEGTLGVAYSRWTENRGVVAIPRAADRDARLAVWCEGYVPSLLAAPFGDQVVVLTRAVAVTLRPEGAFPTDAGEWGYWWRLRRADAPRGFDVLYTAELPFDSMGSAEPPAALALGGPHALPGPGLYVLEVLSRRRDQGRFVQSEADRYEPTTTTVLVPARGGELRMPVPMGAWRH